MMMGVNATRFCGWRLRKRLRIEQRCMAGKQGACADSGESGKKLPPRLGR